jgi:hypothetical protein
MTAIEDVLTLCGIGTAKDAKYQNTGSSAPISSTGENSPNFYGAGAQQKQKE